MSIHTTRFVYCDTKSCYHNSDPGLECNGTLTELRDDLKRGGWATVRGKHYCPDCVRKSPTLSERFPDCCALHRTGAPESHQCDDDNVTPAFV